MNIKEHEEYLSFLKSMLVEAKDTPFGELGLAIPKQKGAFYFGELPLSEYINLYERELDKLKGEETAKYLSGMNDVERGDT